MKYLVIIGDGMSDRPLEELGGKTPLQVAECPNMDFIASEGVCGKLDNVPDGMKADSDVAIMSILGHDPRKYYTGRGPLEAAGMGVNLDERDLAFRCNFITVRDGIIVDYSAGHLGKGEAESLLSSVREEFGNVGDFFFGVDYRHLFVLRDVESGVGELESSPPHHCVGERVGDNLIRPEDNDLARVLNDMVLGSRDLLDSHPVNLERKKEDDKLANSIWLWGQGRSPVLKSLEESYGVSGSVISAVTLVKGLGACMGMRVIDVPGATGYYDTNYEGKADYALEALESNDLVFVHVEAPDEAGHAGDLEKKIEAIENLDNRLIGRILDSIEGDYKIAVLPDHSTPISVRDHVSEPVPLAIFSNNNDCDQVNYFDEDSVESGSLGVLKGVDFLEEFLRV